jgi:(E)-4-hydroxy-3-methyl-but-2-enyl pyrophosphate reductase
MRELIAKQANKKIYLVGPLLHNQKQNQVFCKKGVSLIKAKNVQAKISALGKISNNGTVIVSPAHGIEKPVQAYIEFKFASHHSLTCYFLTKNIATIKDLLQKKYQVLLYAKKNHPEAQSLLSIDKNIKLIDSSNDILKIPKLNCKNHYVLVNQSTIPTEFCEHVYQILRQKLKHIKYINTTCVACKMRFNNIKSLATAKNLDTNLLVVIGDSISQNALSMCKLANHYGLKTLLVTSKTKQLDRRKFIGVDNCAIISSTSASPEFVDQIAQQIATF